MADTDEQQRAETSSQGHILSEGNYLDSHFVAAREAYEASARFAGFQPGWSLLDAGAGGGSFLPILSELLGAAGAITAVDLAPENVQMIQARAQAAQFACPVTAQVSGITSLPFPDHRFDAVWCANVFQYLSDMELASTLAEFKRVVRPGGLIVVKDADPSVHLVGASPITFWHVIEQACAHTEPSISVYFQRLNRTSQLRDFFREAGLDALRYQTFTMEWQPPLREGDRPYLDVVIPNWGQLSTYLSLPHDEQRFWQRLTKPEAADYFLTSPDFYYREGFAVVIGSVPVGDA